MGEVWRSDEFQTIFWVWHVVVKTNMDQNFMACWLVIQVPLKTPKVSSNYHLEKDGRNKHQPTGCVIKNHEDVSDDQFPMMVGLVNDHPKLKPIFSWFNSPLLI